MSRVIMGGEFFVAGPPVQPDRPCYVERGADRRLAATVAARRAALVFGPPALGKTSLLLRCAARLHAAGEHVAFVDLSEAALGAADSDTGRFARAVVQRIATDCGVRPAGPPREPGAMNGAAFADLLSRAVLKVTTKPVTVFVDQIEQIAGTEHARVLFDAITACRQRRVELPEYGRLTFVVAGVTTRRRLWPGTAGAPPFPYDSVMLEDFKPEEAHRLAPGFDGDSVQTRALLDRILAWTSGHPYLTQRIARGVARTGGRLEDVENFVQSQLLAPQALDEEPLFTAAEERLERHSKVARHARTLLYDVAKGRARSAQAETPALEELTLAGLVVRDNTSGAIRFRNRVLREVFGGSSGPKLPRLRVAVFAAAALVAAAAAGTYWYAIRLPQPKLEMLSSPTASLPELASAHAELVALPGFAERANALYVAGLAARSEAAATFTEAAAVDEALASAGAEVLAAGLLADFWLRRAAAAAHASDRDAALLYAVAAHTASQRRPIEVRALDAAEPLAADSSGARGALDSERTDDAALRARGAVVMLAAEDYSALEYSGRLAEEPQEWRVDWRGSSFALRNGVALSRLPLTAAPVAFTPAIVPTALAPNPLVRDIYVRGAGSAGAFRLELVIEHASLDELSATLTAPSGERVEVPITLRAAEGEALVAAAGSPLARLADEAREGSWRLALVDRQATRNGVLVRWQLAFPDAEIWPDEPLEPLAIPDPARTEDVVVTLGASGRYALARPAKPGGVDTIAVWDIEAGALASEIALADSVTSVTLSPDDARLIVVTGGNTLSLWESAAGKEIARIGTQTAFLRPPLFASDGTHFLIAERVDGGEPLVSLLRASDGALVASMPGITLSDDAVLGPGASFLALGTGTRVVTVLDPRGGGGRAELAHTHAVAALWPLTSSSVLTLDALGALRVWPVERNVTPADARYLDSTVDGASVSVARGGEQVAYAVPRGHVLVRDVRDGAVLLDARIAATPRLATRLAPSGEALLTVAAPEFRYWTVPARAAPPGAAAPVSPAAAVALAADAARVVIGARDGSVRVAARDALRAAPAPLEFLGHAAPVTALAAAGAADVAASGGRDGHVQLWSLATFEPLLRIPGPESAITALALDARGTQLASGSAGSLRLFGVADGREIGEVPVPGGVTALAFAPAGALLAVGAGNGTLLAVGGDARYSRAARTDGAVSSLAFAPQADVLASGDTAGNVRLWSVASLTARGAAYVVPEPVRWLGFASDGTALYVVTDHWAHRLAVSGERLVPVASARLPVGAPAAVALQGPALVVVGPDAHGALTAFDLDLTSPLPGASLTSSVPAAERRLLDRDWPAILGKAVNDSGAVVPLSRL